MIATVRPTRRLDGEIGLPGDKSISHRALILGAIGSGRSTVRGLSSGADVESTAACLRALGVAVVTAFDRNTAQANTPNTTSTVTMLPMRLKVKIPRLELRRRAPEARASDVLCTWAALAALRRPAARADCLDAILFVSFQ